MDKTNEKHMSKLIIKKSIVWLAGNLQFSFTYLLIFYSSTDIKSICMYYVFEIDIFLKELKKGN